MSSFPTRPQGGGRGLGVGRFKALSRMSSFPTVVAEAVCACMQIQSFKALSRMSSFPTEKQEEFLRARAKRFKALSRMSSFPTQRAELRAIALIEFQSAVAHELISNVAAIDYIAENTQFQSAVAHELISNPQCGSGACSRPLCFKALSRMSSFPTGGSDRAAPPARREVSKRCRA